MLMKKWMFLFLAVFLLIGWKVIDVYQAAVSPLHKDKERAVAIAQKEINLSKIKKVYHYFGTEMNHKKAESFQVVAGTNEKGQDIFIWISEKKNKPVLVKKAKNGITEQEAIKIVKKERNPKEIISVTLGMENNVPLWEIKYIEEDGRFTYYYIDFENGQFLKRYSILEN
jgi:uncharacterized protein YpmB